MGSGRRDGLAKRSIRVTTNDRANPLVTLSCEARVRSAIAGRALSARFGRIERSAGPQTKTLEIRRGDGGPIAPKLLPIRRKGVEAALREIEAGERYELDITLKPPWPNKRLVASIKMDTGVAKAPQESIVVSAEVVPRVQVVPRQFIIPKEATTASEVALSVVWNGDKKQKIVEAKIDDPKLTVSVEEKEGQQQLVLHVPAGYSGGARAPLVTVTTDDKEVPSFVVYTRHQRAARRGQARTAKQPPGSRSAASVKRAKKRAKIAAKRTNLARKQLRRPLKRAASMPEKPQPSSKQGEDTGKEGPGTPQQPKPTPSPVQEKEADKAE